MPNAPVTPTLPAGEPALLTPPAAASAPPSGPDAAAWRRFLHTASNMGGALLLGSGVVFFFAFNWEALSRFAQLGLAAAALLAATLATLTRTPYGPGWRAGCLLVALCIGALLALIGQTYQTGADRWQLFATWALLMLPVVVLARSAACWLLWAAVTDLAILRWQQVDAAANPFSNWDWLGPLPGAYGLLAANTLLWLLVRLQPRWFSTQHHRWLADMLWLSGLAALACLAIAADLHAPLHLAIAGFLIAAAWLLAVTARNSVGIAGAYGAALLVLVVLQTTHLGLRSFWMPAATLLLGGTMALRHVHAVWSAQRRSRPEAAVPTPLPHAGGEDVALRHHTTTRPSGPTSGVASAAADARLPLAQVAVDATDDAGPWWLSALLGGSAWLSAVLALIAFVSMVPRAESLPGAWLSVPVAVLGIYLMRSAHAPGFFLRQAGFALSMAGQLWLTLALGAYVNGSGANVALIPAAIALLASLPRTLASHRALCLTVAIGCAMISTNLHGWPIGTVTPVLGAAALMAWLGPPIGQSLRGWAPSARQALTFCALIGMLWMAFDINLRFWSPVPATGQHGWQFGPANAMAVAWWIGTVWMLARRHRAHLGWLSAAALLLSLLAWVMPALLLACALALVLFQRQQAVWLVMAMAVTIAVVAAYYYNMDISLLTKSLSMAGAGGALLAMAWRLRPHGLSHAASPLPHGKETP